MHTIPHDIPNAAPVLADAKAMARSLRSALARRGIDLSHGACLELVARQLGYADWNVLAARSGRPGPHRPPPHESPLAVPKDWTVFGSVDASTHRLGLDPDRPGTVLIECLLARDRGGAPRSNAYLMQSIAAQAFLGRRVRLTAELSTRDADLGTLWMRVDGFERRSLRFDNMMERDGDGPLTGTTAWRTRSIVLDVPEDAASLCYGFFLKGYGRLRLRRCRLDVVADTVPVTMIRRGETRDVSHLPQRPANLEFRAC